MVPDGLVAGDPAAGDSGLALWQEIVNVLAPRFCAGCQKPGQVLCPRCARLFMAGLRTDEPAGLIASGSVWSCARYEGEARRAILQWKDHADIEAGRLLARELCRLARKVLLPAIRKIMRGRGPEAPDLRIAVVPVPSSHASARRRGRQHVTELTRPLVRMLRRAGVPARQVRALRVVGRQKKSVARSHISQRQQRSRTAFRLSRRARRIRAGDVVLHVDDHCTTGSTLLACSRLLAQAGHRPLAAFTLGVVPPSRPTAVPARRLAFSRTVFR